MIVLYMKQAEEQKKIPVLSDIHSKNGRGTGCMDFPETLQRQSQIQPFDHQN